MAGIVVRLAQQTVQSADVPSGGGDGAALRVVVAAHLQVLLHLHAHALDAPAYEDAAGGQSLRQRDLGVVDAGAVVAEVDVEAVGEDGDGKVLAVLLLEVEHH